MPSLCWIVLFASCKGIGILEYVKFSLGESRILENFVYGIFHGILGFGIWNTVQGIRNPLRIGIQNPSSTDEDWNQVSGIRNPCTTVLDSLTRGDTIHQVPVVQTLDSAIQWIVQSVFLILIRWIVIYPMDSAIQRLSNRGQMNLPRQIFNESALGKSVLLW